MTGQLKCVCLCVCVCTHTFTCVHECWCLKRSWATDSLELGLQMVVSYLAQAVIIKLRYAGAARVLNH